VNLQPGHPVGVSGTHPQVRWL